MALPPIGTLILYANVSFYDLSRCFPTLCLDFITARKTVNTTSKSSKQMLVLKGSPKHVDKLLDRCIIQVSLYDGLVHCLGMDSVVSQGGRGF